MTSEQSRKHARSSVRTQTQVLDTRTGEMLGGWSRDLSLGGIFVETSAQLPVGTCVEVFVGGVGIGVQVFSRVVHIVPGKGFGAIFMEHADDLARWLQPSS